MMITMMMTMMTMKGVSVGLYNNISVSIKANAAISEATSIAKGVASSAIGANFGGGFSSKLATAVSNRVIDSAANKANAFLTRQFSLIGGGSSSPTAFDKSLHAKLYRSYRDIQRARKNHFIIKVSSALRGDFSDVFNLLVTDLEFSPLNLSGDKKKVGGAYIDSVTGSEATELRFTTYDDQNGTIRQWFEDHAVFVCGKDGTFGLPSSYAIKFEIFRGYNRSMSIKNQNLLSDMSSLLFDVSNDQGFLSVGLFRPVTYDESLSRKEQSLTELSLVFTQLDTFMGV